jgi:hypothetical protein
VSDPIRDSRAMVAAMSPVLEAGEFAFCTTRDAEKFAKAQPLALGWFREREGLSLILEHGAAEALGFDVSLPMRRIELQVHSALDGVGLTAAVAAALAAEGIPCNVVAAYHHDHVFVPSGESRRALAALEKLQAQTGGEG